MGTTVEILAPYLPYGINIQVCKRATGKLLGLQLGQICQEIMADVPVPGNVPEDELYYLSDCLPVLCSFADLCTPLPDGTVPAVEVAKLLIGGEEDEYSYEAEQINGGYSIQADIDGELVYVLDLRPNWDWWLSDLLAQANHEEITVKSPAKVIDYLRSIHFAVGLTPDQYIRRDA